MKSSHSYHGPIIGESANLVAYAECPGIHNGQEVLGEMGCACRMEGAVRLRNVSGVWV